MSASEELRAAATNERETAKIARFLGISDAIHVALANWLDHTAALIEGNSGAIEGVQSSGMALLTACAINDGAS